MSEAIKSYADNLALRWVEDFIARWLDKDKQGNDLRTAIIWSFPGQISNIVFSDSILPNRLSFLYNPSEFDQKKARSDLER